MKRVYIVVEGQTEQKFVKEVLSPYLLQESGIMQVTPLLIKTSKTGKGGFVNYEHLKNTVLPMLRQKSDIIVTTMVDYFRIPNNLPEYDQCQDLEPKEARVNALEQAINEDIKDARFFSYIQLHEFEALLFSHARGFESYYDDEELCALQALVNKYPNPEDMNTSAQGAPSKRILAIRLNYDKDVEGILIAIEVGIKDMMTKCPRFKAWVEKIISRVQDGNS